MQSSPGCLLQHDYQHAAGPCFCISALARPISMYLCGPCASIVSHLPSRVNAPRSTALLPLNCILSTMPVKSSGRSAGGVAAGDLVGVTTSPTSKEGAGLRLAAGLPAAAAAGERMAAMRQGRTQNKSGCWQQSMTCCVGMMWQFDAALVKQPQSLKFVSCYACQYLRERKQDLVPTPCTARSISGPYRS